MRARNPFLSRTHPPFQRRKYQVRLSQRLLRKRRLPQHARDGAHARSGAACERVHRRCSGRRRLRGGIRGGVRVGLARGVGDVGVPVHVRMRLRLFLGGESESARMKWEIHMLLCCSTGGTYLGLICSSRTAKTPWGLPPLKNRHVKTSNGLDVNANFMMLSLRRGRRAAPR